MIGTVSTFAYVVSVAVTISLITAVGTQVITRLSEAAASRRDRYAKLVATLVAWIEFPYRVRRRVDDEPATLASLVSIGHDLQERLAADQAWVFAENRHVGRVYLEIRRSINEVVGHAITEAWHSPPASLPVDMVLGNWGPNAATGTHLLRLEESIGKRFGWRRARGAVVAAWKSCVSVVKHSLSIATASTKRK